jgi:ubiquinone biosynthesis protein UbiJ
MSLPQIFIATLENAINQYLSMDPEALSRFADMEGRVIAIHIIGINQSLYLFPGADGIMVLSEFDGEPDTTISGTPLALARLGVTDDAAAVLFSGEVKISGDTRLGNNFKKILAAIHIDWEEQLSTYVGDVLAHQLGNVARDFSQWFSRSSDALQKDVGEFLQEESRLLVTNAELDKFISDVDLFREALDRLDARISRIKKTLKND